MRTSFKYITGLLGAITMLLPLLFILVINHHRSSVFHTMKERLEEEQLVSIVVNETEVIWVKPGKEISIQGQMFDVKEFKKVSDKVYFKGLFDEDEKELNEIVGRQMKKTNSQDNQIFVCLLQLLQNNYWQEETGFSFSACSLTKLFKPLTFTIPGGECFIDTPPPRC